MTVIMICVVHLAGDGLVFNTLVNMFNIDAVQVRW